MKKLIMTAAAAAALTGMGGAFAQSAECQPGIFGHSTMPGCQSNPNVGIEDHGWGWGSKLFGYGGYPQGQPLVLADGRVIIPQYVLPQQQVLPQFQPSRRDRDGDGVRNSRDRYPDDPRYR